MKKVNNDILKYHRTTFGILWSADVSGYNFVEGHSYTIVVDRKTSFDVKAGPTNNGKTLITEIDNY